MCKIRAATIQMLHKTQKLSCALGSNLAYRVVHFHLDMLMVAEVAPHLGLPVRGPTRRDALQKSEICPGPGGPIPTVLGPVWGVFVPGSNV